MFLLVSDDRNDGRDEEEEDEQQKVLTACKMALNQAPLFCPFKCDPSPSLTTLLSFIIVVLSCASCL
jgi:hypothetical protein